MGPAAKRPTRAAKRPAPAAKRPTRAAKRPRPAATRRAPAGRERSNPKPAAPSSTYALIYAVVRRIPRGRVATYGQIATLAGLPGHARQVGYAMHALPSGSAVPWQRVINASGGISLRATDWGGLQRALLEAEGVRFDRGGRVPLERYRWNPRRTPAGLWRARSRDS